jgi:pimeloyl-ACP methyl ester carboxylesterase
VRVPRAVSDVGDGPVVVLVHGVGIGAWAFADMAAALAADHRVLVPDRRGYGPADVDGPWSASVPEQVGDPQAMAVSRSVTDAAVPASASVPEQVGDLLAVLADRGLDEATWVGVSGGATLVLALAMTAPSVVHAAVVHEPVFGPLAPDLHAALAAAEARLVASGSGAEGVLEFMAGLVGEERLAALPASVREAIVLRSDVIRAEVPAFIEFAPTAADLPRLADVALVATVGSTSPRERQLAAAVLGELAGARVEVIDGVRHLPQLEATEEFEKVIRAAAAPR